MDTILGTFPDILVCVPKTPAQAWQLFITHTIIGLAYVMGFVQAWASTLRRLGFEPTMSDLLLSLFVVACGVGHLVVAWNYFHGNIRVEVWSNWLTGVVSWMFVIHVSLLGRLARISQGFQRLEDRDV